ncbi:MAG: lysophospholipid acyltransferase family protein [Bdellovibrionia bacterium]
MKSALRTLIAWLFTSLYWSIVPLLQLLTFKKIPEAFMAGSVRFWATTTFAILGIRLEFLNASTIEGRGSQVNVSNHQSGLDMVVGAALSPDGIVVVAKKEIAYIPFINLGWWALDFIKIDRSNTQKAIQSLSGVAQRIVNEKRTVWILPEGTRSPPGEIRQFKKGAFHIAIEAQAPVYPVVICGAGELMSKKDYLPKPGVIQIKFLPPVETRGMTAKDVDTLISQVQGQITVAYNEMQQKRGLAVKIESVVSV